MIEIFNKKVSMWEYKYISYATEMTKFLESLSSESQKSAKIAFSSGRGTSTYDHDNFVIFYLKDQ